MRITTLAMTLAAPLALAACDSGDHADNMDDMPMDQDQMAMDSSDMPMMQGDGAMQTATAEGIVTAIDADVGTITVDHGPVAAIEWPAMTMAFETDEQLRDGLAVGDEIAFEFSTGADGSAITSITKK